MEKIILYVDDAAYAREFLARLAPKPAARGAAPVGAGGLRPAHDAPHQQVGEPQRARELARQVVRQGAGAGAAAAAHGGAQVTAGAGQGPLTELTQRLKMEHGAARVVDARRPKIGVDLEPVAPDVAPPGQSGWALPGAVVGMGALLVLANELSE